MSDDVVQSNGKTVVAGTSGGNFALARFSSADALMSVPTTGFEVAATQAQLGRLVEARETLRRVLAIAQSPDDPEPFNEARAKARALDQQLLARVGMLRFAISGLSESDTVELTVDGESVPRTTPLRVNPGHHVVVARAHGREKGNALRLPLQQMVFRRAL